MVTNPLSAATAYQNQLKLMQEAMDATTIGESSPQSSPFMQMVRDAAQSAANTQYNAESVEMQALTGGKVDLSNLVTAVANAELTLSTVIAVRDRVINAYNDIIKMPI